MVLTGSVPSYRVVDRNLHPNIFEGKVTVLQTTVMEDFERFAAAYKVQVAEIERLRDWNRELEQQNADLRREIHNLNEDLFRADKDASIYEFDHQVDTHEIDRLRNIVRSLGRDPFQ